ncbi:MAG: phosphoribosylformylglycinamidine synthase [Candidatus Izemoplasmatales bacterium]
MEGIRIFVEKKEPFQVETIAIRNQIGIDLKIQLQSFKKFCVYEIFGCTATEINDLKWKVFGELVTDQVFDDVPMLTNGSLAYGYLPGQYDQKADAAMQCIQLILGKPNIIVYTKELITFTPISSNDIKRLENYLVNPVEMSIYDLHKNPTVFMSCKKPTVTYLEGFINWTQTEMTSYHGKQGLAMSIQDFLWVQKYFKSEHRDPSETEIRVIDTYWSDHCRHTTFETLLETITFENDDDDQPIKKAYGNYLAIRKDLQRDKKPMTLMDLATIYAKWLRHHGQADDVEVSEEVNACSIAITAEGEEYFVMFKNETHNHPTEIEPFGGASTCLGGAIRDPLSGRSYVYQGIRISGAADILAPMESTLLGKLPQRVISKKATLGFSSYGNQIGLATTLVREVFHPGYVAKRMEVGAVVGLAKRENVVRVSPKLNDIVILVGGMTGRDGIGGATGSSRSHTEASVATASSEVQKGNAPTERKLQRLFSHPEVAKIIKKCNDFGAGGVAVAIGELASSIEIDLDQVPVKYQGLSATELAISESQERMAIVIDPKHYELLAKYIDQENLTIHQVATITDNNRLVMKKDGLIVVDISRKFLDSNGVRQKTSVYVEDTVSQYNQSILVKDIKQSVLKHLSSYPVASQKGMIEQFDSSIGCTTVLSPYGGKYQLTEVDASVQKIPITDRKTDTCTIMTVGFNPETLTASPYRGAYLAVVEALAKCVSVGVDWRNARLSLQEYFRKLGNDPHNWGQVFQALLGALQAQVDYKVPAIGGKDSMSGTFETIHVPPTLIAFALSIGSAEQVISPEFKTVGSYIYLLEPQIDQYGIPLSEATASIWNQLHSLIVKHEVISAFAVKAGGWIEAVAKMSFGNKIGVKISDQKHISNMFVPNIGSIVIESKIQLDYLGWNKLGKTIAEPSIILGECKIHIEEAIIAYCDTFETIYPTKIASSIKIPALDQNIGIPKHYQQSDYQPQVLIIVFPGTNCEIDSKQAFIDAKAQVKTVIFRNQNNQAITKSIQEICEELDESDLLCIPGGFSSGDEPDGSGKFIAAVLLNPDVSAAIKRLQSRNGLILGICNGFQALIKSGLLPYGKLGTVTENSPTLAKNVIGRHVAKMVQTKVISNDNPWFSNIRVGTIHTIPVSHGEGRFVANPDVIADLIKNHQIVTQYVDFDGNPSMDSQFNPNGSVYAIEGILSPDGRILGKMGHSERYGDNLYKNIGGNKCQAIFTNAIAYIKGEKSR